MSHTSETPTWAAKLARELRSQQTLQSERFIQLGALFAAISKGDTPISDLANLGNYLCTDWSDQVDVELERLATLTEGNRHD